MMIDKCCGVCRAWALNALRFNATNLGAGRVEDSKQTSPFMQSTLSYCREVMPITDIITVIIIIFVGVISGAQPPAPPVPDDSCSVL